MSIFDYFLPYVRRKYVLFLEKKNPESRINTGLSGSEPSGTRTPDNLIKSQVINLAFISIFASGVAEGVAPTLQRISVSVRQLSLFRLYRRVYKCPPLSLY